MPSSIEVDKAVPTVQTHLIPFHIVYSGDANTDTYFTPSKQIEKLGDENVNVVYFRGHKLVAKPIKIPDNYQGVIVEKSEELECSSVGEVEDAIKSVNKYRAKAKFEDFMTYGHDAPADHYNQWSTIEEWIEVSKIIHS